MDGWHGALWGVIGGLALEGFDFAAVAKRSRWPWLLGRERTRKQKWSAFALWLIATLVRIGAGGLTAAAFAEGGQVANALSAFGLGVAGPAILERAIAVAKEPQ